MRGLFLSSVAGLPAVMACTALLGIDEEYTYGELQTGGAGSGGDGATGGAMAGSGGRGGASGAGAGARAGAGTGGTVDPADASDSDSPCPTGQKRCAFEGQGEVCLDPNPLVGCAPAGCDSCPAAPSGGFNVCSGEQCDFQCRDGYVRNGSACDPIVVPDAGTGGSGSGGTGSSGPCSTNADCPACTSTLPGCCTPLTRQCGCQFPFWCQPSSI
jgi:hypothetical protein